MGNNTGEGQMPTPRLSIVEKEPSSPELQDDVELAHALIAGDEQATFVAWSRLLPLVGGTIRRLLGPDSEAEDLVQEVFLRFFRKVRDLREPSALRSFAVGICIRVARKEIRRRWLRRWLRVSDDGVLPEEAEPEPDHEARQAMRRYYEVLDRIGGQNRSLFVTRHIEGLELAEVAKLHGISISTAQRRLARVSKVVQAIVDRDPVLAAFISTQKNRGGTRARA